MVAEESHRHERLRRTQFAPDEGGEQGDGADDHEPDRDLAPREPRAAPFGNEQQGAHPRHHEHGSEVVDRVIDASDRHLEHGGDDEEGGDAEREVDVEDPAPREALDEEAAEQGAGDAGDGEDPAEEAGVSAALAWRDDIGNDGHDEDHEPAAAEALDGAGDDEPIHRLRGAGKDRADEEHDDRDLEHRLAAVDVGDLAAVDVGDLAPDWSGGRRGKQVGGDDPCELVEPAEVARNARERCAHDGLVQRGEEEHERAHDEGELAAPEEIFARRTLGDQGRFGVGGVGRIRLGVCCIRGGHRAGDRDRTGMASLEGWGSTIELHPRFVRRTYPLDFALRHGA